LAGGYTFRPLRRDETDAAARIHRRCLEAFPFLTELIHTPEEDRAFYREAVFADCTIVGAFDEDALVGHVAFKPGWIEHFYVDPERQSRGIGGRLLERAKAALPDIQLLTFQANEGARRFYERHGFEAVELTDGAGNEEGQPDVRYRWRRPGIAEPAAQA